MMLSVEERGGRGGEGRGGEGRGGEGRGGEGRGGEGRGGEGRGEEGGEGSHGMMLSRCVAHEMQAIGCSALCMVSSV